MSILVFDSRKFPVEDDQEDAGEEFLDSSKYVFSEEENNPGEDFNVAMVM